jgi:hypothetical protein
MNTWSLVGLTVLAVTTALFGDGPLPSDHTDDSPPTSHERPNPRKDLP